MAAGGFSWLGSMPVGLGQNLDGGTGSMERRMLKAVVPVVGPEMAWTSSCKMGMDLGIVAQSMTRKSTWHPTLQCSKPLNLKEKNSTQP